MSLSQRIRYAMFSWDKKAYRACFREDFLFTRETELLTLDEHVNDMDIYMTQKGGLEFWNSQRGTAIVHENEFVQEVRWQDGDAIITNMIIKNELGWRAIVNRVAIDQLNFQNFV